MKQAKNYMQQQGQGVKWTSTTFNQLNAEILKCIWLQFDNYELDEEQ